MTERVLAWLRAAPHPTRRVLFSDPDRTYAGLAPSAERQVPTTRELEDFDVKRTGVWEIA